ncbi:MAG: hypothetical protein MPJ50_11290 [Pirellulales bacterium]|nr:hypothetical protein [Pirellulales bacterium]
MTQSSDGLFGERSSSAQTDESNLPLVWVWQTTAGDLVNYNLACLTDSTLFVRQRLGRKKSFEKVVEDLYAGSPPEEVFPKKSDVIPLDSITELRCGQIATILEIHHGQRKPTTIKTGKDPVFRDIYVAIRQRIAPSTDYVVGKLGLGNSIGAPAIALTFSVLAGALFIVWAPYANANPQNVGRHGGLKNLIEKALAFLGLGGTIALTVCCVALAATWLVFRLKNPHSADVVSMIDGQPGSEL